MSAPAQRAPRNRLTGAVHTALAVSLLGLWMSGTASPAAILLLAGVLAWAAVRARRGVQPSERVELLWNLAALAYLGFFVVDLALISRNLLGASLRLLIFLSVQRLLAARTERDRMHLLLISFLAMVAATAATTEFTFAVPLALYLVAALRALACRQLDRSGASRRLLPGPPRRALAGWSAAILAVGTMLFFLIPHVGTGYFRRAGTLNQRLSGFSGRIELGSINSIKKNHELALRVRVNTPVPAGVPLRWRGLAFDRYDGRAWSRSDSDTVSVERTGAAGFEVAPATGENAVSYDVSMEPMGTSALFAAADAVSIRSTDIFHIRRDAEGAVHHRPRRVRVQYEVESELNSAELLGEALRGGSRDYPREIRERYLELPDVDPRIAALARQFAGGASDPYEVVGRIFRRLRQDYIYTLDVNDRGVADPLGRFLLDRAPGHCEYFATAMTVMARLEGIPARVVAGFLQGEYSDLHGIYLVRQSDAHSWVEVYFPEHGWVGFDPTPPVPVVAQATLMARMRRALERVEIAWDTWIVGLDLNDQASIMGTLRDWAGAGASRVGGAVSGSLSALRSLRGALTAALAAGVVLALAFASRRYGPRLAAALRRWRRRPVAPGETDRLLEMYRRFLRALERHGIRRGSHLTPLEFARSAADPSGRSQEVREVTDLFCRARYGGHGLTAAETLRIETTIAALHR